MGILRLTILIFFLSIVFMVPVDRVWAQPQLSHSTHKTPKVAPPIRVLSVKGKVVDLSLSAKVKPWTMRSKVADRLELRLEKGAETQIQLNPQMILTAYGDTDFEIPIIGWESRQFKQIKLKEGILRLQIRKPTFDFVFSTPFFEVHQPEGLWVYHVDKERALADILDLQGKLEVNILNSDDKVALKSGERISFRGVLEEGEIAYDLLLEGRKIPKGRWMEVQKITSQDHQNYSLEFERKRRDRELKAQAHHEQHNKINAICTKPVGDLGDCIWRKKKEGCIRMRCTADGIWKDSQVVQEGACDKMAGWTSAAKKCDY